MIGRAVWVSCDGGDTALCDEEVALQGDEATANNVRREARRQGWYTGSMDLCPRHRITPGPTSEPT